MSLAAELLLFEGALPSCAEVFVEVIHGATPTYGVRLDYGWAQRIVCGGCYRNDANAIAAAISRVVNETGAFCSLGTIDAVLIEARA